MKLVHAADRKETHTGRNMYDIPRPVENDENVCGCESLLWWTGAAEVMDSERSIQTKSHPRGKIIPPWMFTAQGAALCEAVVLCKYSWYVCMWWLCTLPGEGAMWRGRNSVKRRGAVCVCVCVCVCPVQVDVF